MRFPFHLLLFVVLSTVSGIWACSSSSETGPAEDTRFSGQDGATDGAGFVDTLISMDTGSDHLECVPVCDDRVCGPDGCGGNCGECGAWGVCLDGECCMSLCGERECGADGCGGSCGSCPGDSICLDGDCCVRQCQGKECGSDGCGGVCGECSGEELCLVGTCSLPDADLDGVPDEADLFGNNPGLPGVVNASMVYAHTATELYQMDVKTYMLTKMGDFQWPAGDTGSRKMTDIGIDRYGVLYGVTFESLYTCHPQTVQCTKLGELPGSFNGMTLIPKGFLGGDKDMMVGIAADGTWFRLDLDVATGVVEATAIGGYGGGYKSAGDAYSIEGVGTFAAVYKPGENENNYLIKVDPATGAFLEDVGPINGYIGIFGLAGWTGRAFAFDKTGDIVIIDTATAQTQVIGNHDDISWWGAGVATLLD